MKDINTLVAELTVEEKISMLAGIDLWQTKAVPRLGIPSITVTDGPNGARGAWGDLGPSSALFPVGTALAATWNTELIERTGSELARETRAKAAQMLLGPTVNIHRSPIAGRNFECFSEDPYLTGKMAAAYIRGLQREGISGCIKHFVCNDQEFQRFSISAEVDERTRHEIYLEPFRRAMVEARPWSIMSSYNRVNGTYSSENAALLKDLLKEKWGFDGLVISDWKGTYSEKVPEGGLDLEMPGPARWMSEVIVREALQSGRLTEAELDDKIRRLLRLMERTGVLRGELPKQERAEDTPAQRAFMRSLAQETIVLLKNQKHCLPLEPTRIKKLLVVGELAERPNAMGGGSSRVSPHYVVSPLDGIRARAGAGVEVQYALGCIVHRNTPAFQGKSITDETGEARGLTLRLYDNLDFSGKPAFEMVTDRCNFDWWGPGVPNVNQARFSARMSGIFTAEAAGLHTFALSSIGKSRMLLDGEAVLSVSEAVTYGKEQTAYKTLAAGQKVRIEVEYQWDDTSTDWRVLRIGHWPPCAENPLDEAAKLAANADAVIVVAGLTNEWEAESFDRVDMRLPGKQDELIEKIAGINPNTIVVLNAGSPVTMPWVENVPAIIQQWYNSQECGNALADVLFGDTNPSGKLPTTFPRYYEDNPSHDNYPGANGKVHYREGLLVGYRHYDTKRVQPLFPFGHGLSYTSFHYSNIHLSAASTDTTEGVDVSVDVKNVGPRAGKEVIQLYVHDMQPSVTRPEQELKAFAKAELQAGETKTIRFHLGREAFWYYDVEKADWQVKPGDFEIRVGRSSRDLPLRVTVHILAEAAGDPSGKRLETA